MQDSQSDPDNCRRLGVDEQYINFRPSPNFKNMKKFLKCKIDYSESSSQSPPNGNSEQTTPNTANESPPREQQQMDRRSPIKQVVHPPLPLEPPPPDTPPIMPVPIKNEVIDNEYPDQENGLESPCLTKTEPEEVSLRLSFDSSTHEPDSTSTDKPKENTEEKKREVCRDFIRGTCTRAGTCRYLHQRDLSQLAGIYTFCRDFQNTICTLPFCRYVHATIFEQQEFYRTGVLPPHVQMQIQMIQNYLKKPYYMPPPPPPPPPEEAPPEVQNACALSSLPPNSADKPLISCVPVSKLESKPAENDFRNMLQAITSPLKRDWSMTFSSPPRDLDNKENQAKKCKNCVNTDIRLQYNKEKLENMVISTKELQAKSQALTRKTNILYNVLYSLMKQEASTSAGMEKLRAIMIMSEEKEKAVLLQIMENNRPHYSSMM